MKRARRKHSEEFKLEAVKLVLDGGLTRTQVGSDLGLRPSLLGRWVKEYEERGGSNGLSLEEREELKALRKENTRLRMERDILKKATAFFAQEKK